MKVVVSHRWWKKKSEISFLSPNTKPCCAQVWAAILHGHQILHVTLMIRSCSCKEQYTFLWETEHLSSPCEHSNTNPPPHTNFAINPWKKNLINLKFWPQHLKKTSLKKGESQESCRILSHTFSICIQLCEGRAALGLLVQLQKLRRTLWGWTVIHHSCIATNKLRHLQGQSWAQFPRPAHLYPPLAVPVAPCSCTGRKDPTGWVALHPFPGVAEEPVPLGWQKSQCLLALAVAKVRAW